MHSTYLLFIHVVSCFDKLQDLATKRLKTPMELHD